MEFFADTPNEETTWTPPKAVYKGRKTPANEFKTPVKEFISQARWEVSRKIKVRNYVKRMEKEGTSDYEVPILNGGPLSVKGGKVKDE